MSKQRLVDTCFWDDAYIMQLDPSEKLLFLYFLTNPLTALCGVYQIEMRRIAFDTGFEVDTVKRMLDRFERDQRCVYRDGWIAMRNWLKHQNQGSAQIRKGIECQLLKIPNELGKYMSGEGIEALSYLNLNSNSNSNSNTKASPAAPTRQLLPKFSFTPEDGFGGIPHEDMRRWADTYPAVDIAGEIKKAAEWIRSNPAKRKSNYRRFLTNWFNRTQERGGTSGYKPTVARPAAVRLVPPQPLSETERKENLKVLDDLQKHLAKDKHV